MEPRTDGRNKFYSEGIIWNIKVRNKSVHHDAIYLSTIQNTENDLFGDREMASKWHNGIVCRH